MKYIHLLVVLTLSAHTAPAQQSAAQAYAKGDDTYIIFSDSGYKTSSEYLLISISNKTSKDVNKHLEQSAAIEKELRGKENVRSVNVEWTTEGDLREKLKEFGINIEVSNGKNVRMTSDKFNLQTSSANAFFLIENKEAALVCSGPQCEKTMKRFFSKTR